METLKEIISTWYGLLITAIVLTSVFYGLIEFTHRTFQTIVNFFYNSYLRTMRFIVLMRYGYPPETCDVDGDFKPETTNK